MQHTTFTKKLNFNKLIILDCLKNDELQTAKSLYENLSDKGFRDGIAHIKIPNIQELLSTFQDIIDSFIPAIDISLRPIIHIESHGNKNSITLPDGSYFSWKDLADRLRIINQLMNNQLIIFIGACHGYHFIYNNHTIKGFTPVYFCIAPLESIPAGDIQDAALKFYESLFLNFDLKQSAELLHESNFYTYNSDYMFHRVFHEAMQKHHRGNGLKKRREFLVSEIVRTMGTEWETKSKQEKSTFLNHIRCQLNLSLRSKESLKKQFVNFSIAYMGYANEQVFEEIWRNMQYNNQGKIY
ncbi:hypothetical protein QMS92_13100 [Cronobacter sakazakii]|nr:hypothetical protein [Cronobacter sakazakii]EKK5313443.1 hypothetical protein [Cronobacter sakazakii]MDK1164615.1 hypothetical protein [Cronobacter sakazakii]